jgi:hypothetical protein
MTRASLFVYHCTHLSSRIQALLETNEAALLLAKSSSILHTVDSLETTTDPLDDPSITDLQIPSPLASPLALNPDKMSVHYMALVCYTSNFRMWIALSVLHFVTQASCCLACTAEQQALFMDVQERCAWEFQSLAHRVLSYTERQLVDNQGFALGWLEATMMYGSLRTIAGCQLSSSALKEGARKTLVLFKEHLGMACPV